MTAYRNCKVSGVQEVIVDAGEAGVGYGFSILNEVGRPVCSLSFATREDAEETHGAVARAIEKAIEVTSQG